jgi:2-octaprenyl-6-methoxyphenol hydroxylase
MADRSGQADIVIAGGGTAGLAAAIALSRSAPDLSVLVADPRPPGAGQDDQRASAIAAAARRMLERLGVWPSLAGEAQPILSMEITDSRTGDAVRPVFLTFDGKVGEDEPFAHMVPNGVLAAALSKAAREAGVVFATDTVESFEREEPRIRLRLGSGGEIAATLLVAADGMRSRLRGQAGIRTVEWRYPQTAIVVNVAHERPHEGLAIEHFLPSGPFAVLPLKGNRSSLVWTERAEHADKLVADDFVFHTELERRFGHRLGALRVEAPPQTYPLGLMLARDFVRPRFALLGDAAHGIHPIAGQGLNLGLRDAAALAEVVVDAHRLGLDFGAVDLLRRYERWRRFDTWQMGVTTDLLNRLFSNDWRLVRAVRDLGLGMVDRLPALKRAFIGEAAGFGGDVPKLLRGEAI